MSHILSLRGTGQPIAYFPKLGKYIGCVKAGIFLGQMVFWSDKTDNPLGVYKTSEQIEEETGLSYREQANARKKLVALGLISETYKRLDHRLYFKFNEERFDEWLTEMILANSQSVSSPTDESAVREQTKAQFVPTENTTENTTDINTHPNAQAETQNQDWNPNLEQLAIALRTTKYSHRVSEILGMEDFQFHLGNFNAHHEKNHQISDNQKLRKFAQWIFQEFERSLEKAERKNKQSSGYSRSEKQNSNLDVNTAWNNQPVQQHAPVNSPVHIPEDFV
ncbi:hypothetical protein NI467_06260 [Acinetobacter bohemicus]|uniref:hypothetical protein n=1 Tax=Acinetobacter sp. S4397-1 TaxID=2972915 RepID=UPI00209B8DDF|nr:hypothetical protein [Acinetobacter sp. S4397-1]MCO8044960.1 hypothetical protein [Acinetobacter sp. S4397-1]